MSESTTARRPNHLADETSPYLKQHAHNPVDWYPWGPIALSAARSECKPIFLSVGYSACHWCHVMRRECFEDQDIAEYLNKHFVCIKVDREERPDLDHIYQEAAHLLSGEGGWPLSVFLTPDLHPFFSGTYFPPESRHGRPGFPEVLQAVHEAFTGRRDRLTRQAAQITSRLSEERVREDGGDRQDRIPERKLVAQSVVFLSQHVDREYGGFGDQPKFPNVPAVELLLRQYGAEAGQKYVDLAVCALRRMAMGGIYDQVGGGFHRYATDSRWLIPHFEKMLYDNALLPPLYLTGYQLTGDELFRSVARETIDYVLRDMTHPAGGFFSTQDADSEGEEGKFYVWRPAELRAALGDEDAEVVVEYYGVTDRGNFKGGKSVLYQAAQLEHLAKRIGVSPDGLRIRLQACRAKLRQVRERREHPHRDEKVLAGWNGLMVTALARGAAVLGDRAYTAAAEHAVGFIWDRMRLPDGRLCRSWNDAPGDVMAFLEDYAFVCRALLDTYQATLSLVYLERAKELMDVCIDLLWDSQKGGFFMVVDTPDLIHRPKPVRDQAIPSGNAVAAQVLMRLNSYVGRAGYMDKAERILAVFASDMEQNPWSTAGLISALDDYCAGPFEIAIVRSATSADNDVKAMLAAVWAHPHPGVQVYSVTEEDANQPLVCQGKTARQGKATAYACRNFTCSAPIVDVAELHDLMSRAWHPAVAEGSWS